MQIRPMKKEEAHHILALYNEACIQSVGYPLNETNSERLLSNLKQYAGHEDCHCWIVEDDGKPIAYVQFVLLKHPIQGGLLGEIEELYAQDGYEKQKQTLVQQAVNRLKQDGATVVTTCVGIHEPEEIAFWKAQNWAQDTVNYNIYSDPGDPDEQAIWDAY